MDEIVRLNNKMALLLLETVDLCRTIILEKDKARFLDLARASNDTLIKENRCRKLALAIVEVIEFYGADIPYEYLKRLDNAIAVYYDLTGGPITYNRNNEDN